MSFSFGYLPWRAIKYMCLKCIFDLICVFLFVGDLRHKVRHALAQLCAVVLRNEKLERWPQFIQFVLQASHSNIPEQRQVCFSQSF